MPRKYSPFESAHLKNFQVVEQHEANISKFPHTEQLPKLLTALNQEFRDGLPDKIARVDHRGSDFMKYARYFAAAAFCGIKNEARKDGLHLFPVLDQNKVAKLSVVQEIVEHAEKGPLHRFKFFAGEDFFLESYPNCRRVCFAGHVLERFTERTQNESGTDRTNFLFLFFGAPVTVMECNNSPAFVFSHDSSIVAFPVRLFDSEYFFPTCLAADQISALKPMLVPIAYPHTLRPDHSMPDIRNWDPVQLQLALLEVWERKQPMQGRGTSPWASVRWSEFGHHMIDIVKAQGHGEGSRIAFFDNVHGLNVIQMKPDEPEAIFNLQEFCKEAFPAEDSHQCLAKFKADRPEWFSNPRIMPDVI